MGIDANGNLQIFTNEDLVFAARWTDQAGAPYLLSAARMQIRKRVDDTVVLVEASVANGRVTLDGVAGWANVFVAKSTLAAALTVFGVARYDLVVTRVSDGTTKVLARGIARIRRGVTRD